ncbi:putative membrane protein [Corynebacterium occultum]|uniref:Putative membrane protein n=1 Tax=Corynebacterium occultum TaxID=2675219 RepID=A0A6B8W4R2_9CORY|nr:septum formation family protein [Corynebacterium occultum]QGU08554.1 putative membrane protein [Corynebacterium occultum]
MSTSQSWRSATAIRTGLVAALAATVAVGTYSYVDGAADPSGDNGTGASGSATTSVVEITPFTTADSGDCLTWDIDESGVVSNFEQTPCSSEHRFEISAREDLATYPSSEFGLEAAAPDLTRQAQLREELCSTATIHYLDGRYDPVGRYSIAPILPPAEAWAAGDRTMLCGIQATDGLGNPVLTIGPAAEQDQARVSQPGECVFFDNARAPHILDCAEDHHLETTAVVNLRETFPDRVPSTEEQDGHLAEVCTAAAIDYLGEEEILYQSTLQPYWATIPSSSWNGGSHSVNCSLMSAHPEGGFSLLKGSATGEFTINGNPPEPQPERDPLTSEGEAEGTAVPGEAGSLQNSAEAPIPQL